MWDVKISAVNQRIRGDGSHQRLGRTGSPVRFQCGETRTRALKRGRGEYNQGAKQTRGDATRVTNVSGT